jgi:hypothetical protein
MGFARECLASLWRNEADSVMREFRSTLYYREDRDDFMVTLTGVVVDPIDPSARDILIGL